MAKTVNRFKTAPWLLAGALLSAASTAAWSAVDPVLGQASSSITNLRYRLIDLTPDDGNTPWIQFANSRPDAGWAGRHTVIDDDYPGTPDEYRQFPADPFEPTSAVVTTPWNSAEVGQGPGSVSLSQNFGLSDEDAQRFRHGPVTWYRGEGTIRAGQSTSLGWVGTNSFTLSAHTALVLEGTALVSGAFDTDALLANATLASGFGTQFDSLLAESSASARVWIGDTPFGSSAFHAYSLQSNRIDDDLQIQRTQSGFSGSQDWLVRFDNLADQSIASRFEVQVNTSSTLTATVPEPSSWALIAAGLLVAAGVGRRTRQA